MARHRRGRGRRRRGMRGFGSVITVRPAMRGMGRLSGLGRGLGRGFGRMGGMLMGLLAPLLGLGVPAAVILAIRAQVDPARGATQQKLVKYAPAIGFGAGVVTSLVTGMLGGMGAGLTTVAGGAVSAGSFAGYDYVRQRYGARIDGALASGSAGSTGTAPTGVIVPEFRGLPARTGAIVMEQAQTGPGAVTGLGRPGQVINLGSVNPGVFGTPGF